MKWKWLIPALALGLFVGMAYALAIGAFDSPAFRELTQYEAVHIVAHSILYGGLTSILLRVGWSIRGAATLAIAVAVVQELAQDVGFGRWPGGPELFDLFVDACAIAIACGAFVRGRSRSPGPVNAIEV